MTDGNLHQHLVVGYVVQSVGVDTAGYHRRITKSKGPALLALKVDIRESIGAMSREVAYQWQGLHSQREPNGQERTSTSQHLHTQTYS
jgi:hypothetical protein